MAEAILLVVSKMRAVILNDDISAVIEKLSMKVTGLKELPAKIKRICNELKEMNVVIQDLGTTYLFSNVITGWITNVRKVAYYVEDVIDKYSYETLKLKEEGFLNRYAFKGSDHIKVFNIIVNEVAETHKEILMLKEMHNYWINTFQSNIYGHAEIEREHSVSDNNLVGIDENRSKLTKWLTTDEKESTLITVYGMGGLGKTTLVKNVYDREKDNFPEAHAWIVVSQAYGVADILTKLLTKIRHTQQSPLAVGGALVDQADVYELREAIKQILQDKRFLIVLDDMWDKEAYNWMCSAFQGLQGSRVMITTRIKEVAALAPPGRCLLLQPLGSAESSKLFFSRAFSNNSPDHKCPLELETLSAAIISRCHGLPLAIVSSGSLFSTKQPTKHAWDQMYNQLQTELQKNDHVQGILNMSYHDLPGDLRNCFLYCTLFPQGHPIPRESLVRLWVAEGFTVKKDITSTPEEVAEEYLMELIDRNMLEVVERDEHFRVSTCKMHDIVRDLALAVAKKERFGSATDQREMLLVDREVRWFSTCGWSDSNKTTPAGVQFPRLRTVVSIGSSSNMLSSVFAGSSLLTILELQDSPINQVPASIGNLFNLRYIGLRRTEVQSLPDTIDKLSNLETLDLKHTRIEKLPPGIVKVCKLRHLLADRYDDEKQTEFRYCVGVEGPKFISNFQELQTLETVHASQELTLEMKKMDKLQTICIDRIDASNCEELFRTLSDMRLLSSLVLSASNEKEILSFHALKPISKDLHRLILRGGWASRTEDPLQLLASHLQALTYLSLNRVTSEGTLVLSAGCFPHLKTLVLKRMPNVKQLVIEEGAILCIEEIYILTLLGLNAVPDGIELLGSLKKLWMLDLHREFKADWIRNHMDYKMEHVADLRV